MAGVEEEDCLSRLKDVDGVCERLMEVCGCWQIVMQTGGGS